MTNHLELVLRQVELQRNTALSTAAVSGAHVVALEAQLIDAGAEIANLRGQLGQAQSDLAMAHDAIETMEKTVMLLSGGKGPSVL